MSVLLRHLFEVVFQRCSVKNVLKQIRKFLPEKTYDLIKSLFFNKNNRMIVYFHFWFYELFI